MSMTDVYKTETGKSAWESWGPPSLTDDAKGYLELYVEAPTHEYIKWLEDRASKINVAQNSTSPNISSPKLPSIEEVLKKLDSWAEAGDTAYRNGILACYEFIADNFGR